MLSKHPERCRYPHGHTRTIEVVVAGDALDENGMLIDFKALKELAKAYISRLDHAMAVNSDDPLLASIKAVYPDSLVIFEGKEPTTEVIAEDLFRYISAQLKAGFRTADGLYSVPPNAVSLERVRVWETPTSWAECAE